MHFGLQPSRATMPEAAEAVVGSDLEEDECIPLSPSRGDVGPAIEVAASTRSRSRSPTSAADSASVNSKRPPGDSGASGRPKGRGKGTGVKGQKQCQGCFKYFRIEEFPPGSVYCSKDKKAINNLTRAAQAQGQTTWFTEQLAEAGPGRASDPQLKAIHLHTSPRFESNAEYDRPHLRRSSPHLRRSMILFCDFRATQNLFLCILNTTPPNSLV